MDGSDFEGRASRDYAYDVFRSLGFPSPRETALVLVVSVVAYSIAAVFLDDLLAVNGVLIVELSDGLAVPLGIVFGPPAAIGVGVGVLASDMLNGALSAESVLVSGAHVVLAFVAYVGWRRFPRLLESIAPDSRRLRTVLAFSVVTVVSSLVAASFLAWTYELVGAFPFYISFGLNFVDFVTATAVMSPLIGYPLARAKRLVYRTPRPPSDSFRADSKSKADWMLIGVAIAWALFGVIGSVGFDIRSRLSIRAFRRRGLVPLYEWVHPAILGHGGRRVQVVFGTVMFLLLVVAVTRTIGSGGPRWN